VHVARKTVESSRAALRTQRVVNARFGRLFPGQAKTLARAEPETRRAGMRMEEKREMAAGAQSIRGGMAPPRRERDWAAENVGYIVPLSVRPLMYKDGDM